SISPELTTTMKKTIAQMALAVLMATRARADTVMTNLVSITVSSQGTNISFQTTNGTYGTGIMLSNALTLANLIQSNHAATGTDSNVLVTLSPGVFEFDYFMAQAATVGNINLSNGVSFLGSGKETVLTYTNLNSYDIRLPITFDGGNEVGRFATSG